MDISAREFNARYRHPGAFILIDVREKLEFDTFNLGGENIPLNTLAEKMRSLPFPKDTEIVVVCQHGIRSETAASLLSAGGYLNIRNLAGGLLAWRKENANTTKNSLEEQNGC